MSSELESRTLLAWSDGVYERETVWTVTTTRYESVWQPAGVWWKPWTWRDRETLCTRHTDVLCWPTGGRDEYRKLEP
jgi:hypothetical protein